MSNLVPVQDIERMALAVAKSGLFGVKTSDEAMALMLIAQAEGQHPAIAARDYHIIQGRPALKADAMLARFQGAGGKVQWEDYTDERVSGIFSHPSGGSITVTWTIDQAKHIGLVKPSSGWHKYPRAMLRSRCISEGIRSVYPGCVVGTYSVEEAEDFDDKPAKVVTPEIKDMGAADIVDEIKSAKTVGEDFLPLYIPGQEEPYDLAENLDAWETIFYQMISKVKAGKLDDKQKLEKLKAFKKANQHVIENMTPTAKTKEISSNQRWAIILLKFMSIQQKYVGKKVSSYKTMNHRQKII